MVEDRLMGLDDGFVQHYRRQRQALIHELMVGTRPVLLRVDDPLILLHAGQRRSQGVRDAKYHQLKAQCHAPIALYLLLRDLTHRPLTEEETGQLSKLGTDLTEAAEDEAAARTLAEATQRWLEEVLRAGACDASKLRELEACTREATRRCIERAAELEMGALHSLVMEWTDDFSSHDWQQLRVVVCAGAQPRYGQATKQYFTRLLQPRTGDDWTEQSDGPVLYAENCRTEQEALAHLATNLLDRQLGAFFLDSPLALQQDVLADATQRVLDELMPTDGDR